MMNILLSIVWPILAGIFVLLRKGLRENKKTLTG